jgi:hypothetical protein
MVTAAAQRGVYHALTYRVGSASAAWRLSSLTCGEIALARCQHKIGVSAKRKSIGMTKMFVGVIINIRK